MGVKKRKEAVAFALGVQRKLDPDPAHGEQVTRLALNFFDELGKLHGLGPLERHILYISAMLHDTGWSEATQQDTSHHKLSGRIIRKLKIPGLTKKEVLISSLVARYHTKALPDARKHKRFSSLSKGDRNTVEWLSGMLRAADGLDCRHLSNVNGLKVDIRKDLIRVRLTGVENDCRIEMLRAARKHDLLVKKAARKIEYSY